MTLIAEKASSWLLFINPSLYKQRCLPAVVRAGLGRECSLHKSADHRYGECFVLCHSLCLNVLSPGAPVGEAFPTYTSLLIIMVSSPKKKRLLNGVLFFYEYKILYYVSLKLL